MVDWASAATDARSHHSSESDSGILGSGGEVSLLLMQKPRLECTTALSMALVFELREAGKGLQGKPTSE